jgi:predicted dehydrogenase
MIKIGTVGTGKIVELILSAIMKTEDMVCSAIYSREEERGRTLANKFQINKVYTDYDQLLADEELSFIYLASPNSVHYKQAIKALEAGKNVIIEKPFTSNYKEAVYLSKLAKDKGLFLFEAVTTMYLPNYSLLKQQVERVGRVRIVHCDYSQYSSRYDLLKEGTVTNIFNPEYSGGALMDLGVYNVHFMVGLFGSPEKVYYYANRHENGIDTSGILILSYPDFICECTQAKDTWGNNGVQIQGENGFIDVKKGSNGCDQIEIVLKDQEMTLDENGDVDPWTHEFQQMSNIIKNKNYEVCYRNLETTLQVMKVLEEARRFAGIRFLADE